jgi:hypothetical protein
MSDGIQPGDVILSYIDTEITFEPYATIKQLHQLIDELFAIVKKQDERIQALERKQWWGDNE